MYIRVQTDARLIHSPDLGDWDPEHDVEALLDEEIEHLREAVERILPQAGWRKDGLEYRRILEDGVEQRAGIETLLQLARPPLEDAWSL